MELLNNIKIGKYQISRKNDMLSGFELEPQRTANVEIPRNSTLNTEIAQTNRWGKQPVTQINGQYYYNNGIIEPVILKATESQFSKDGWVAIVGNSLYKRYQDYGTLHDIFNLPEEELATLPSGVKERAEQQITCLWSYSSIANNLYDENKRFLRTQICAITINTFLSTFGIPTESTQSHYITFDVRYFPTTTGTYTIYRGYINGVQQYNWDIYKSTSDYYDCFETFNWDLGVTASTHAYYRAVKFGHNVKATVGGTCGRGVCFLKAISPIVRGSSQAASYVINKTTSADNFVGGYGVVWSESANAYTITGSPIYGREIELEANQLYFIFLANELVGANEYTQRYVATSSYMGHTNITITLQNCQIPITTLKRKEIDTIINIKDLLLIESYYNKYKLLNDRLMLCETYAKSYPIIDLKRVYNSGFIFKAYDNRVVSSKGLLNDGNVWAHIYLDKRGFVGLEETADHITLPPEEFYTILLEQPPTTNAYTRTYYAGYEVKMKMSYREFRNTDSVYLYNGISADIIEGKWDNGVATLKVLTTNTYDYN